MPSSKPDSIRLTDYKSIDYELIYSTDVRITLISATSVSLPLIRGKYRLG